MFPFLVSKLWYHAKINHSCIIRRPPYNGGQGSSCSKKQSHQVRGLLHVCWSFDLKGTKSKWDNPNKTFGGKKYQLRKIAFITKYGKLLKYDLSHRCSNAKCINLDHVVDEQNNINQSRKYCKALPGQLFDAIICLPTRFDGSWTLYHRKLPISSSIN